MPATEHRGSSTPLRSFCRSILHLRHDQLPSMDDRTQELELETFLNYVSEQFTELASASSDELLSLSWVGHALDVFLCCQEKFHVLLSNNVVCLSKPPTDRLISEFYERSVKALDVCNAIRDGIEQVRQWDKSLEIVLCALDNQRALGEGQIRRAKKALTDLLIGMLDEKESNYAISHRNRSFGRNKDRKNSGHFRSHSWSLSRSWSASKQLQAMGHNLSAPKASESMATNGFAMAVYAMNCVLVFVMWALVAAIPCQDRGLQIHFSIPRQFIWGNPIVILHDRIIEDSKKREKKNSCGLLKEVWLTEKWSRQMNEVLDSLQFPLAKERETEVREKVEEMKSVFENLRVGLPPLERQVREVFHRIVRDRTQGLDSLGKGEQC